MLHSSDIFVRRLPLHAVQYRTMTKARSFVDKYREFWRPQPLGPPYSHITQIGDPVLRSRTEAVPAHLIKTQDTQNFIKLLKFVMNKFDSVGLSAPQIGIALRIFVIEFSDRRKDQFSSEIYKLREMSTTPFTVFINPELKVVNYEKTQFVEACESVRGYCAEVPRYREVIVNGLNENGEQHTLRAKGWTARILQHEMDHLNGRMYTDIMDKSTLSCGCWQAVNAKQGRINIPFAPK